MQALSGKVNWRLFRRAGTRYEMEDTVTGVRSNFLCGAGVVTRESGFLKKYKGRRFGKRLSARAGVGMESN